MRIPLDFECCNCKEKLTDLEGKLCNADCKAKNNKTTGICDNCLQEIEFNKEQGCPMIK
ncbi:hypothetical protein [Fuchsiella alkaliacetigena]|uniref:hypothetical protein n=1 Tax=Fuchsiella alkaliacetigena TaxID=957042 RepID=UPI00200A863F|nr:hypothetical protein [Fuchsiella alkaliacetigena]MCK8823887.1 hypothetical protein [Fuchsiella alkaliacetigena]